MAVINVTPLTDITALIASDGVNEGDVLFLEEGIYLQTVIIPKNNIRVVAKGPKVIFDGKGTLITAFTLSNVTGVLIEGINIRQYRTNGIVLDGGSGNRIVKNTINNINTYGIEMLASNNNLIWKNEICSARSGAGIRTSQASANNWIIDNTVKDSTYGFQNSADSSNNSYISNLAINNRTADFDIGGSNILLLDNLSIGSRNQGIVLTNGSNNVVIGNTVKSSRSNGISITGQINLFTAENHIECARQAGISYLGQFGTFLSNEISHCGNNGITLSSSINNLVMDNKLVCNIPVNINNSGTDNVLINNIEKPCGPCEAPSDVCDDCTDKADNS